MPMNGTEKIAQFFQIEFPLNQEGLAELLASFSLKNYPKNSLLLQNCESETQLRFLQSGIVREYFAREDKEHNIDFYTEPSFISDFSSFFSGNPSFKNQACLSEVRVQELDRSRFLALLDKYKCGQKVVNLTFRKLLAKKEQNEYLHTMQTPDERYQRLLAEQPQWLELLPQYHIASYLGITPETLSRIRKRII